MSDILFVFICPKIYCILSQIDLNYLYRNGNETEVSGQICFVLNYSDDDYLIQYSNSNNSQHG